MIYTWLSAPRTLITGIRAVYLPVRLYNVAWSVAERSFADEYEVGGKEAGMRPMTTCVFDFDVECSPSNQQ